MPSGMVHGGPISGGYSLFDQLVHEYITGLTIDVNFQDAESTLTSLNRYYGSPVQGVALIVTLPMANNLPTVITEKPMTNRLSRSTVFVVLLIALLAFAACESPERADTGYILAIEYKYKMIPVEQLRLASDDHCYANHYHAKGAVVTLRGETLSEPDSKCGFGPGLELREVLMPDDYQGVQRTDKSWRYNPKGG